MSRIQKLLMLLLPTHSSLGASNTVIGSVMFACQTLTSVYNLSSTPSPSTGGVVMGHVSCRLPFLSSRAGISEMIFEIFILSGRIVYESRGNCYATSTSLRVLWVRINPPIRGNS